MAVDKQDPVAQARKLREQAARVRDRLERAVASLAQERAALAEADRSSSTIDPMSEPLILWRWWITDERTGEGRLTSRHMTEADALERYPDAERDPSSREERRSAGSAAGMVTKGIHPQAP